MTYARDMLNSDDELIISIDCLDLKAIAEDNSKKKKKQTNRSSPK